MSAVEEVFPEVYGAKEVAQMLGVHSSNLGAIPDLPLPVTVISAGRIWLAEDIVEFAEKFHERRRMRLSKRDV